MYLSMLYSASPSRWPATRSVTNTARGASRVPQSIQYSAIDWYTSSSS